MYRTEAVYNTVRSSLVLMPLSDFNAGRGSVVSGASPVFVFFNCPLRGRSTLALALVLTPVATFFFFFFLLVVAFAALPEPVSTPCSFFSFAPAAAPSFLLFFSVPFFFLFFEVLLSSSSWHSALVSCPQIYEIELKIFHCILALNLTRNGSKHFVQKCMYRFVPSKENRNAVTGSGKETAHARRAIFIALASHCWSPLKLKDPDTMFTSKNPDLKHPFSKDPLLESFRKAPDWGTSALRCPETLFISHENANFLFQSLEWFRVRPKHQK